MDVIMKNRLFGNSCKLFILLAALLCATTSWAWSGTGTSSDPYQISSVTDWESLATSVKEGNAHAGEYFVLTTDISLVTTMVGQGTYPFSGTFDGGGNTLYFNYIMSYDYVAPFRYVKDATIKNLKVAGTINTSAKFAAGLVGLASGEGTTTIENCRISIWILSTVEGDGTHGGIVAHNRQKALNITGCVFDGRLSGENTTKCGGFVGWNEKNDNAKTNIKDCLFKPNVVTVKGDKTFARTRDNDMSYVSISNSYYTSLLGDAQGKQAFTVTGNGVTVAKAGTPTTYSASGISVYGNNAGFMHDGVIYGGNGDAVTLTLSGSDYYAASTGTLRGFTNPYTLTMASANAVVSVGTAPPVTIVKTESELRSAVGTDGAYVRLGNDIKIGSILEITGNRTLAIDLNNFTLDRGCTSRDSQVIVVRSGSTLNLSNGTVTGGWGGNGGALDNEGTTYLDNVTITGNTADDRGGGIGNRSGGTLIMTGCTITGNTCNDQTSNPGGGGIYNAGTLIIDGGSITNNQARTVAGGIGNVGTLQIKGAITVTDNVIYDNIASNMALIDGNPFVVVGSLAGSHIGITRKVTPRWSYDIKKEKFSSGYSNYNGGVAPAGLFYSDISFYGIGLDDENTEAALIVEGEKSVYYIDHEWDDVNKKLVSTVKYATSLRFIDYAYQFKRDPHHDDIYCFEKGDNGKQYTYIITGNVTIPGKLQKYEKYGGDEGFHPKLILCDGAKLTVTGGIYINSEINNGCSLSIYGQMNNTGQLYVHTSSESSLPGIGSGCESLATLNIHGGTIDAKGANNGPGIGASIAGNQTETLFRTINIYGGNITAQGDGGGAGIGTGGAGDTGYLPKDYGNINIYGGTITAKGGTGDGGAGIGGGERNEKGTLHIYGGQITATGGHEAAGIGCGQFDYSDPGTIIIEGGKVTARGDNYAAGIGGGDGVNGANVTITGGEVYAYGGIDAAGIGGGEGGDGGTVKISGGYVYAQGKDNGAGIGGGEDGEGASVTITGGTVVAKAGLNETGCRAIGPGKGSGDYGQLTLGNEMMVTSERTFSAAERKNGCWYRTQVRVEPCMHEDCTYTIDGTGPTNHHTKHCPYCATTFEQELHDYTNSSSCKVCGVEGTAFFVKIYLPKDQGSGTYDGHTYDGSVTYQMVPNTKVNLPACPTIVPGMVFIGWEESTVGIDPYESPFTDYTGDLLQEGDEYTITKNVSFLARYDAVELTLYDNADNAETLSLYDGRVVHSATLTGRTLYKNGQWNTLCLPFNLALDGSPLEGATVKTLESSAFADGTLTLNFTQDANNLTSIVAGKPYIVRWDTDLLIDSETAWDTFAANVNSGTSYEGKIVRMTNNISVSTMVGLSGKPFMGTFDGQGHTLTFTKTSDGACAPFRNVDGATIKNLNIVGTITAGNNQFAAGLIAYNKGNTTVSNCRNSITINSTRSGDGTHGGFIANLERGAVTFTNCLFDGTLSGASTTNCGGFVGWTETNNGASVTFNNCFFNPATVSLGSGCKTFARLRSGNPSLTKCYYKKKLSIDQGIDASSMGDSDVLSNLGSGWEMKNNQIVPKTSTDNVLLTFSGVTIDNTRKNVETEYVDFVGCFSPVDIDGEDRTMLYMGANNKLYYPNAAMTIKSCRAYFLLKGIKAGDPSQPNSIRAFNLNFDDDTTTDIILNMNRTNNTNSDDAWYDLQGRKIANGKLSNGQLPKGVYINNGRKVVIK